jgi:acetyl-CoA C-acetyltransferase
MKDVYILDAARTPVTSFLGELSSKTASELGACAINGCFEKFNSRNDREKLEKSKVEKVYMGNVLTAGVGQAPARQSALYAELGVDTECITVNKVCGSGLQSVIMGAKDIAIGENKLIISGGMESMSNVPHLLKNSRSGFKYGDTSLVDSLQFDGLWDIYTNRVMGLCAEECVEKFKISREDQDDFAKVSYMRAQEASNKGYFENEIVPVIVSKRKKQTEVKVDESIFQVDFEKLLKLRPAFKSDGSITAGNASSINDGAAAVILSDESYKEFARYKIVGWAGHAQEPTWFTVAPVKAIEKLLKKTNKIISDIDLFEINEAFSLVAMHTINELQLKKDKVNVLGGAVSLGHPIGASGTRILVTLMNAMDLQKAKLGVAAICIGGGEALALMIERID